MSARLRDFELRSLPSDWGEGGAVCAWHRSRTSRPLQPFNALRVSATAALQSTARSMSPLRLGLVAAAAAGAALLLSAPSTLAIPIPAGEEGNENGDANVAVSLCVCWPGWVSVCVCVCACVCLSLCQGMLLQCPSFLALHDAHTHAAAPAAGQAGTRTPRHAERPACGHRGTQTLKRKALFHRCPSARPLLVCLAC